MLSHWLCFKMADKIIMWKLRCGDMWKDEFFCFMLEIMKKRLKNNCEGGKLIANKLQKSDSLLSRKSHVVYEMRYNVCYCCPENFKCNFSSLKFRYRVSITYTRWMWSMWHQSIRKLEDNLKIEFILVAFSLSFFQLNQFSSFCARCLSHRDDDIYLFARIRVAPSFYLSADRYSLVHVPIRNMYALLHLCTLSSLCSVPWQHLPHMDRLQKIYFVFRHTERGIEQCK